MLNIALRGHSTDLIGLSTAYLASHTFNDQAKSLHIAGTRKSAPGLFKQLEQQSSLLSCGNVFQDYMCVVFRFETEQRLRGDPTGRRRYKSSYLTLFQDWGRDSNNTQGAVFKGWIESRFGLFPTFHKDNIASFRSMSDCYY